MALTKLKCIPAGMQFSKCSRFGKQQVLSKQGGKWHDRMWERTWSTSTNKLKRNDLTSQKDQDSQENLTICSPDIKCVIVSDSEPIRMFEYQLCYVLPAVHALTMQNQRVPTDNLWINYFKN